MLSMQTGKRKKNVKYYIMIAITVIMMEVMKIRFMSRLSKVEYDESTVTQQVMMMTMMTVITILVDMLCYCIELVLVLYCTHFRLTLRR